MKLPDRWHIIPLNQVIRTLQAGVSVNSLDEEVQDLKQIGILKTSSVTTGRFDPRENKMVVQKDICRVKTPVQGDRIILSRMNTPCLVGANAYVPQDYPNLFLPDRLWSLEPQGDFICMHWLSFVLGSSEYRQKLSELATGTSNSMKNISKDAVMALGCVVNRFVLYYANVKKRISGKWRMHTNDMIYRMNLGLKSNFCYRGARELGAATLATTGNLSMRYFGFYERGHLGVICHRVTEIGKILTGVFAVGVTKEFGRNYCRN